VTEIRNIRELQNDDAHLVVDYFHKGPREFLWNMGVDPDRLPPKDEWIERIVKDLEKPLTDRSFYYLLWELDSKPIGHSNINNIKFGDQASMHLHVWNDEVRRSGHGTYFVKASVQQFFKVFELKKLFCAPNAKNEAPNKTLKKIGFTYLEDYEDTPGFINYKQTLSKWVIRQEGID